MKKLLLLLISSLVLVSYANDGSPLRQLSGNRPCPRKPGGAMEMKSVSPDRKDRVQEVRSEKEDQLRKEWFNVAQVYNSAQGTFADSTDIQLIEDRIRKLLKRAEEICIDEYCVIDDVVNAPDPCANGITLLEKLAKRDVVQKDDDIARYLIDTWRAVDPWKEHISVSLTPGKRPREESSQSPDAKMVKRKLFADFSNPDDYQSSEPDEVKTVPTRPISSPATSNFSAVKGILCGGLLTALILYCTNTSSSHNDNSVTSA